MKPALPPLAARGVAFAALAGFGLLHWMAMLDPAAPGRAFGVLLVAVATGLAVRAPRRLQVPLVALGALAALVAAGLPAGDLWPTHWGRLFTSIGSGIESVAGARIPYAGTDPDLRLVLPLGGALLAAGAAPFAFDGRRHTALVLLVTLYAVPAVSLNLRAEFLRGALMTLLVIVFLRLERLPRRELAAGGALAAAAAVAALAAAPALDTKRPWFDYEEFAQKTASARSTSFSWDHDYSRLPWSRDGREMLRVRSKRRAYWKVDELDKFDGFHWVEDASRSAVPAAAETLGVSERNLARWTFPISVGVRNLRSDTLALAGTVAGITFPGRQAQLVAPGTWSVGRPIHRGDAYDARVYVPQPSRTELEAARGRFPVTLLDDLSFDADAGEPIEALAGHFKAVPQLVSYGSRSAAPQLRNSNLRRIYALSQRLLSDAATPYDYARAIQRYLGDGFSYDETPPRLASTLDGFLFDTKSGFCQHYSGAMALLLRMGGVPARVATGFAPGSYDEVAKRYVVRDLDAHSWVEAWFGGIGWVVFDPTPAAAPPRSQALGTDASAGNGDIRDRGTELIGGALPDEKTGTPWASFALLALALLATAGAGGVLLTRRRSPHPQSELERALRGAGEPLAPGTTLTALELRLPAAAEYLGALRAQRYAAGAPPTAAARRSLRRALVHGRGPLARARTWIALRPRRPT